MITTYYYIIGLHYIIHTVFEVAIATAPTTTTTTTTSTSTTTTTTSSYY